MNRFLVFDFDILKKTGLHWAVMRNHKDITKLLIREGAVLTAKDEIGRTPLYIAAVKGHLEAAKELLLAGTPVISCSTKEESILKVSNDPSMVTLLKKAVIAQANLKLVVKPKDYYREWKNS